MTLRTVSSIQTISKNEKGDLVTDCLSILARWRDHFSQLFNAYEVTDVRQTEIRLAEMRG
jgi:hypothetical protein